MARYTDIVQRYAGTNLVVPQLEARRRHYLMGFPMACCWENNRKSRSALRIVSHKTESPPSHNGGAGRPSLPRCTALLQQRKNEYIGRPTNTSITPVIVMTKMHRQT